MVTGSGGAAVDDAEASEAAASAEAGGALESAVCAKAGALTSSAKAPIRAMRGIFLWLSNICRQFLIGVAHLGRGSPRPASSQLELIRGTPERLRISLDRLSLHPTRHAHPDGGLHFEGASATTSTEMGV